MKFARQNNILIVQNTSAKVDIIKLINIITLTVIIFYIFLSIDCQPNSSKNTQYLSDKTIQKSEALIVSRSSSTNLQDQTISKNYHSFINTSTVSKKEKSFVTDDQAACICFQLHLDIENNASVDSRTHDYEFNEDEENYTMTCEKMKR
ncbi:hypothetical protein RF11_16149 [Thelohanellus kitauei]|uniref:Uncharacterized protein n=1 Tax=Thelohanellus kitauei TaxID=669202 RepID=A0A0C2MTJ9_THEKT|nr:hypothetical protein RF11_16149 [Thelohanellus kitauei]